MNVFGYAGSFDMPTNGHKWMMREIAKLGKLVVLVADNPQKKYLLATETRVELLYAMLDEMKINGTVHVVTGEYTGEWARRHNARLVRGIRDGKDFDFEMKLNEANVVDIGTEQTLFLMPPAEEARISSSFVKSLIGPVGWHRKIKKYLPKQVYDKIIYNWLWNKFTTAIDDVEMLMFPGMPREKRHEAFEDVYNAYKDRPYHNIEHLVHVISEFGRDANPAYNAPAMLTLAAFYHDYYQQVRDGYSAEHCSANHMAVMLHGMILPERLDDIYAMIRATEHTSSQNWPVDHLWELKGALVSADLAILGRPQEEYDDYMVNVRQEYSHVPADEYHVGRGKVLASLIKKAELGDLYPLAVYNGIYNDTALENMRAEYDYHSWFFPKQVDEDQNKQESAV